MIFADLDTHVANQDSSMALAIPQVIFISVITVAERIHVIDHAVAVIVETVAGFFGGVDGAETFDRTIYATDDPVVTLSDSRAASVANSCVLGLIVDDAITVVVDVVAVFGFWKHFTITVKKASSLTDPNAIGTRADFSCLQVASIARRPASGVVQFVILTT